MQKLQYHHAVDGKGPSFRNLTPAEYCVAAMAYGSLQKKRWGFNQYMGKENYKENFLGQ
jgi:hypothetical protein